MRWHSWSWMANPLVCNCNLMHAVQMISLTCRNWIFAGGHKCVQQSSSQSLKVMTSEAQYFTFDAIAGESTDQEGLFQGL